MSLQFYIRYHTDFGQDLFLELRDTHGNDHLLPMQYLNEQFWYLELPGRDLGSYRFVVQDNNGNRLREARERILSATAQRSKNDLKIYHTWNFGGQVENVFDTAPFKDRLLPTRKPATLRLPETTTHVFKVRAPLLKENEVICLLGEIGTAPYWNTDAPILLQYSGDYWETAINLSGMPSPAAYKYGIWDKQRKCFLAYESGDNRLCMDAADPGRIVVLEDGFLHAEPDSWKGAGLAIPVFSLRRSQGAGIGEFTDLHLLADWAAGVGLKLIQLLPVNDTTATGTNKDSYPYAAISAFALHPIYINLSSVAGKAHIAMIEKQLEGPGRALNELEDLDYASVLNFKTGLLRLLYNTLGPSCLQSPAYRDFFETNRQWLEPYAVFCYYRDTYKTADFTSWPAETAYQETQIAALFSAEHPASSEILFHCFIQYHLHCQLQEAVAYAHQKGVVMKGDIPIGVYRYGCDAWMAPELYNMDQQAGAPPDDFADKGQNWGFPTYNWQQMQNDGFAWWRQRFAQMSHYFDAFRIDHILGFFRIWSIPVDAVQGTMGRFVPALPVRAQEFGEHAIWFDRERYCRPYITDEILYQLFGEQTFEIKTDFLIPLPGGRYQLRPEFDTQRKVEAWFAHSTDAADYGIPVKESLYELISNVILFEETGDPEAFHFRIDMEKTWSFRCLSEAEQYKLKQLYIDYFYRRQDDFWKRESLKKLPSLKAATNMLVCGEDLGMVPHCVPEVMQLLGILSLEIQRMPKAPGAEFFNPAQAPYLSVITPSTHDMSTIRGWWQEDPEATRRFYNKLMGQTGEPPFYCEPWICRAIILQHLFSPAMWSIFQLQDLLAIGAELRRKDPDAERINIPADPNHYWKYRMHLPLEDLLTAAAFNQDIREMMERSGRAN
ncbi:4-alpha-glucanotransferase [Niabella terrae]